jgi:hypothetical protein
MNMGNLKTAGIALFNILPDAPSDSNLRLKRMLVTWKGTLLQSPAPAIEQRGTASIRPWRLPCGSAAELGVDAGPIAELAFPFRLQTMET